jgi:hypothetical protein
LGLVGAGQWWVAQLRHPEAVPVASADQAKTVHPRLEHSGAVSVVVAGHQEAWPPYLQCPKLAVAAVGPVGLRLLQLERLGLAAATVSGQWVRLGVVGVVLAGAADQ